MGGGVAVETSFGTFYGTNLTPDPVVGLGGWSEKQFARAMHRGKGPRGKRYYPAFPFTSYTQLIPSDLADLWAYLRSLEPVSVPPPEHELRGAARVRPLLALWRLSFRARTFKPDPERSETWNRGAYLVAGPGHCGECHTPRRTLGRLDRRHPLGGSELEPHGGPAITPPALQNWSSSALDDLLVYGMYPDGDFASGGMGAVVQQVTSALSDEDRAAVIVYLKEDSAPAAGL